MEQGVEVQRWAMIENGVVTGAYLWDGDTGTWQPPEGVVMEPAPDYVGTGWGWDGGGWIAPAAEEIAP